MIFAVSGSPAFVGEKVNVVGLRISGIVKFVVFRIHCPFACGNSVGISFIVKINSAQEGEGCSLRNVSEICRTCLNVFRKSLVVVFQVFCYPVDYIRSLVSSSVNVRRFDVQFIRNERNVAEEAC